VLTSWAVAAYQQKMAKKKASQPAIFKGPCGDPQKPIIPSPRIVSVMTMLSLGVVFMAIAIAVFGRVTTR
jgi:hypothetical protein